MRLFLLLFVLLRMPHAAAAEESPPLPTDQLADKLEFAMLSPCTEVAPRLIELTSRPDFSEALHPRRQSGFLLRIAMCTADNDELAAAFDYANRAAAADPESFGAQGLRLQLATATRQSSHAVEAFEALSRLRSEFIRQVNNYRIIELVNVVNQADPSGDSAFRVFDAMARVGWQQPPPYFDDAVRVEHARLLVQRGRIAEARVRLAPVNEVSSLVAMRADRRFDPLREDPAFEAQLDLAEGAVRNLARAKGLMESHPRMMLAAYQYAGTLIAANDYPMAYELVRSIVVRLGEDPGAFDDGDGAESSMTYVLGMTLYAMGRIDEGRDVYQQLVGSLKGDPFQGSVRMAFANHLVGEGRAAQALDTLSISTGMSPWGKAWVEAISVCAAVQLNDNAAAMRSLAYLRTHESDHDGALQHALLCLNDLDGLAELMIRRLNDPVARPEALKSLQAGPANAFDEQPFMRTIREREATLRAREDVLQAVDAVGRIETIPVRVGGLY
jgi:tetratricopeptide (TPR) repeat protein